MERFTNVVGTPSTPKFVEAVIRGELLTTGGEIVPCLNVFHFKHHSGPTTTDPLNFLSSFTGGIQAELLAATVARYTLSQTEARFMDSPAEPVGIQVVEANGDIETDPYASDAAVYMLLRTGYRGRSFKGAKHFGGLAEEDTVADQLDASGIVNWGAVGAVIEDWGVTGLDDGDGNVYKLVVLQPTNSDLQADPSIFTGAVVVDVLLNKTIGTMGRRRQKTIR